MPEPMLTINLNTIVSAVAVLGIAGLARYITHSFREIGKRQDVTNAHLSILNGRISRAETWREAHERELNALWDEVKAKG